MKVGIYIGNINPHDGGGYTFQEQLLIALDKKLSHGESHSFIVFHYNKTSLGSNYPHLKFVQLKPPLQTRVTNRVKLFFGKGNTSGWLDGFATQYEIDFMWFITYAFEQVNIPYCYTIWDLQHRLQPYFKEVTEGGEWDKREQLYTNALKKASYVITGTQRGKDEIKLFYGVADERIRILPLPTPSFEEVALCPIDHLVDEKLYAQYLFYPAQFWTHKNHIRLIEAVHVLKHNFNIFFNVYFVGSDKGTVQYLKETVAKLEIANQLHFLGFVPRGELASLYKNAFALIFPSMFGPDNLPPLEAFSLKCPCIVSDIPGAREQYGSAALFFDPLNTTELVNRILELKNDKSLRAHLIEKGERRANDYTRDHYIGDVFKVIEEFYLVRKTWTNK